MPRHDGLEAFGQGYAGLLANALRLASREDAGDPGEGHNREAPAREYRHQHPRDIVETVYH